VLSLPADPSTALPAVAEEAQWRGFVRRFAQRRLAVFGLALVVCMAILAVFAPLIAPHSPYTIFPNGLSLIGAPLTPQWFHGPFFLGTDDLGRDELSQLIFGARVSMEVGFMATLIAMLIGTSVGVVAGYVGGVVDNLLMRLTDIMLAFPFILFCILLNSVIPRPSVATVYGVIGILGWAGVARIARGATLSVKNNDYVVAARSLGASAGKIMVRHVLPNAFSPVLVYGTLQVANFILLESALSFLGAGVPDPIPSWGKMLNVGLNYYLVDPYLVVWPGVMLALATLGFNLFGDGLNDALNPRSRKA
jgi:peptide/nickel transport system permease protein